MSDGVTGSPDEIEDLKTAYLNAEGDMDKIMASMLCSTFEDEPRFTLILKELIQKDSLPDFTAFSKESQKKKKARQKKVVILKRVALTIMGALCIF